MPSQALAELAASDKSVWGGGRPRHFAIAPVEAKWQPSADGKDIGIYPHL
jgi:hypothetical protein